MITSTTKTRQTLAVVINIGDTFKTLTPNPRKKKIQLTVKKIQAKQTVSLDKNNCVINDIGALKLPVYCLTDAA